LSGRNQNMQAESDGLNKRIAHSERAILRRKVASYPPERHPLSRRLYAFLFHRKRHVGVFPF
jgi:hypothetical protein